MKTHKPLTLTITTLLLGILFINTAIAFGVSTSYWKGNPLQITPGEIKEVELALQNMVGDADVTVNALLTQGEEIARVEEGEYLVPAGTKDTTVPVTVQVPENAPIGSSWVVTITFQTINQGAPGAVALGTGMQTTFDVEVINPDPEVPEVRPSASPPVEQEEERGITGLIIAVILIAIALVVWLSARKKN